ncbi:MAG: hypothetical protein IVW53_15470 [Chloroflexi bacterium]|nr:hypothetical protein [Chloroflexota bacterium]
MPTATDDTSVRRGQQVERRLVAEWLVARHGDDFYQQNVRLGSMPLEFANQDLDPMEAKLVHNAYARWADAIIFGRDKVTIVEAKIVAHPVALGQLRLYSRLLPFTPNVKIQPNASIEMLLLYAIADDMVLQLAREDGITLEQFHPDWVDMYIATRLARQRQGSLPQQLTDASDAGTAPA